MKLIEKILMPIDIDSVNKNQINIAEKLITKFNSQLEFLYVLPLYAYNQIVEEKVKKAINLEFDAIKKNFLRKNLQINYNIRYGNIFDQIMEFAIEKNVNLILIGDKRNDQHTEFNIGSNAEKIIRKSTKPVWVVKNDFYPKKGNILCAIDFSDSSKRALENAIKISKSFKLKLHVINVFESYEQEMPKNIDVELESDNIRRNENEKQLDSFLKEIDFTEVDYKIEMLNGITHKIIIEYIKKHNIEILFIGTTGKSMLSRILIGSITEKVSRELPCSMVTTKSENILKLKIDADISSLEQHYEHALKLEELGYFHEAINQFEICVGINDLHIPSLSGLSRLYNKIGNEAQSNYYDSKVQEITQRLWNKKIEEEIRKHYRK